ncbi:MAG TPA: peptide chain release factor 3 [Clostridiales bacterium]|nr:peptide chain release factor 3 [Clostridia bacterium]MDD4680008.1 peptide chain release factor 3 [Clostridia bacterium]HCS72815.1 peptide chain release factor 3 [Clostridiales bacterium]
MEQEINREVKRRRTFAIISHPDAGKTTITEKLLLYGGAIRLAGTVKSRKSQKYAVSDWMEIEKQRGISVTSSVMQFDYDGCRINILDTPGHQDFSEDTYRTLMAADSAVMLIDGGKGVEAQTIKLFQVCKMRGIPIFTFINKMDRQSRDPFELMEEIENVLGIRSFPMNWPIGIDGNFKGVYNRTTRLVEVFKGSDHGRKKIDGDFGRPDDPHFRSLLGDHLFDQLQEEIELLDIAGDEFNMEEVLAGELTPIFFGSAMTNFGVRTFLENFLKMTPPPVNRPTSEGRLDATDPMFSGFVFKIQANMNPTHRDRIAFIRICSGKFTKGMEVNHIREGKKVRLSQPQQFVAQDRVIVEEAYAGDIIGIFDPGVFHIGDTLVEGNQNFTFEGIPLFPAEHFARVRMVDAMKRKQYLKGIEQIAEEGAIQIFRQPELGADILIVGVVGVLQLDVLSYRLKNEYGVDAQIQMMPYTAARWVMGGTLTQEALSYTDRAIMVEDYYERPVVLFSDKWSVQRIVDRHSSVKFVEIPPSVLA